MPNNYTNPFSGIQEVLKVSQIASFEMLTCSINDHVAKIMSNPHLEAFDYFPVRDEEEQIVGVLPRSTKFAENSVRHQMVPLNESHLISADAPIETFVQMASEAPFRLVFNRDGIQGIVTQSDLLKLPVRLLAFAYVTNLEQTMAGVIESKFQNLEDAWLKELGKNRQVKILDKQEFLNQRNIDSSLLNAAEFCDKRDIVAAFLEKSKDFVRDLKDIERLRNSLAHASVFISEKDTVEDFISRLGTAKYWINEMQKELLSQ